jgi:hypothetical protein
MKIGTYARGLQKPTRAGRARVINLFCRNQKCSTAVDRSERSTAAVLLECVHFCAVLVQSVNPPGACKGRDRITQECEGVPDKNRLKCKSLGEY